MFAVVSHLYGQSDYDTCNDLSLLYMYDPMDTKFNAESFEQRSNQPLGFGVSSMRCLDRFVIGSFSRWHTESIRFIIKF
jgi:hypothetical protein